MGGCETEAVLLSPIPGRARRYAESFSCIRSAAPALRRQRLDCRARKLRPRRLERRQRDRATRRGGGMKAIRHAAGRSRLGELASEQRVSVGQPGTPALSSSSRHPRPSAGPSWRQVLARGSTRKDTSGDGEEDAPVRSDSRLEGRAPVEAIAGSGGCLHTNAAAFARRGRTARARLKRGAVVDAVVSGLLLAASRPSVCAPSNRRVDVPIANPRNDHIGPLPGRLDQTSVQRACTRSAPGRTLVLAATEPMCAVR
jgi:hypothetical protein